MRKTYILIAFIGIFTGVQSFLYGKDLSDAITNTDLKAAKKIVKAEPGSVNKKIPEKR